MRTTLACAVLIVLIAAGAEAQNAAGPAKKEVTDMMIINTCGDRLVKMFGQYGTPLDVVPIRGDTPDDDDVLVDYGTYIFRVHDRIVRFCFFRNEWPGTILGIKIGDSREDVEKVLGAPRTTFKDKNGVLTDYGYHMKDLGIEFYANFDDNGKLKRVEIKPLE